ncbi:hypothetical protein TNCT_11281 [Trichonephila clavata]|uniref:Uncharacterized protein n=1 Tax=Trichonephila clavata TaxID=2740835 RepID=A0A8X6I1H3_TRICU|nr:hypothetical protein TNCT_11281 [Trichonephila clavata]
MDEALEGTSPCIVVEDGRQSGGATGTPLSLLTKEVFLCMAKLRNEKMRVVEEHNQEAGALSNNNSPKESTYL